MKLTFSALKSIIDNLKAKIANNYISNISVISSTDILISFSKYREERLFLSLDHQSPFMYFVDSQMSFPTMSGRINESARKEIKDGLITDIEMLNDDRIVKMSILKTNDVFEKNKKNLIIELIPTKPNLIIADENHKIIFAVHENSLEKSRPLMRGLLYELPIKNSSYQPAIESVDLSEIKNAAEEKLMEASNRQHQERFAPLFRYFKSRSKSLAKKEIILKEEIENAQKDLLYLEHGNMLLSLNGNLEDALLYVKNHQLNYDEKMSIGVNANHYFKKYKKAKRTIQMAEEERQKALGEIQKLDVLLGQSKYMSIPELNELALQEAPHLFETNNLKKSTEKAGIAYVLKDKTKIYFGKNAKQNEQITFKIAQPLDWFFHIKDYPGSHVVINSSSPTDDQMLIAGEMCLILSNKTSGEINFAQVKEVKKSPKVGQVNILHSKALTIKNIRRETFGLLSNYQKVSN